MTVVTMAIITAIVVAGTLIIPKLTRSSSQKGCCVSAGGYWVTGTGQCKQVGTDIEMNESDYWNSSDKSCLY